METQASCCLLSLKHKHSRHAFLRSANVKQFQVLPPLTHAGSGAHTFLQ